MVRTRALVGQAGSFVCQCARNLKRRRRARPGKQPGARFVAELQISKITLSENVDVVDNA